MNSTNKLTPVSPKLFSYLEHHSLNAHPILSKVAEETAQLPDAVMQIPKHQGGFMYQLIKLTNAKVAIEVGCYTGYSAIAVAAALPAGGKLTTFDTEITTSNIARKYFKEAGLDSKIDLVVGDATVTLKSYVQKQGNSFADFVFIDADKVNYDCYYELCLTALKPNGIMILDNAFRDGDIVAADIPCPGTRAIATLTEKIKIDPRVEATMLPIADGLILVRKI